MRLTVRRCALQILFSVWPFGPQYDCYEVGPEYTTMRVVGESLWRSAREAVDQEWCVMMRTVHPLKPFPPLTPDDRLRHIPYAFRHTSAPLGWHGLRVEYDT